jgi:hypothetical protein
MFRKKTLAISIFFGLVIVGLGACSNKSPVDQIIDRKTFLKVQSDCRASTSESVECVVAVFNKKTSDYCAKNELSPGNRKCVELQQQVKKKVADNFTENLVDAFKE